MENKYSVAISCRSDLGYLEYDENTKMDRMKHYMILLRLRLNH